MLFMYGRFVSGTLFARHFEKSMASRSIPFNNPSITKIDHSFSLIVFQSVSILLFPFWGYPPGVKLPYFLALSTNSLGFPLRFHGLSLSLLIYFENRSRKALFITRSELDFNNRLLSFFFCCHFTSSFQMIALLSSSRTRLFSFLFFPIQPIFGF